MIAIRPQSAQNTYDDFASLDPAIVQLPENATAKQKEDHEAALERARETGDWSPIIVPGKQPTKFQMKLLRGEVFRTIVDDVMSGKIGPAVSTQIAFRAALMSISGDGAPEFKRKRSERYGDMAPVEIADQLDAIDVRIVAELGHNVMERARKVSPKS